MGFWVKDPLELEIEKLKKELVAAKTEVQRERITTRLQKLIELDTKSKSNQIRPTGDGIMKCLTAIGLGLFGFYVERNGGIIPKWAKPNL